MYNFFSSSYNICIRQEQGACCIKYSLCSDTYTYAISNTQSVATGANQGTYCNADHLEIVGVEKECGGSNIFADRLCGGAFNVEAGNTVSASSLCGMYMMGLNFYSTTNISRTFKSASNSGNFEIATNFLFLLKIA